jgi:aminotransferase
MVTKELRLSQRVVSIPPSGIRVIYDKVQQMKDVVSLEIGEPEFETPPHIREAAKKALDQGYTHYTPSAGLPLTREAISQKLKTENNVVADPRSEIVVTSGACSAVYLTFCAIINQGDEVLIPNPCWPHYEPCVILSGGKVVRYPLHEESGFGADIDEIRRLVSAKTKAILINSPANPTGGTLSRTVIEEIAALASEKDLLVVSDEVYERILYDGESHLSIASLPGMKDRTVTVNALSKTYAMTGWRIGYAVSSSEIIAQLIKLNLYTNTCANAVAQVAGAAALGGPQDAVVQMVKACSRRRELMIERLNEIEGFRCVMPKGAFYAFPNTSGTGMSSFDLSMALLDEGHVSTVPGVSFGDLGEGHVRLCYAISERKINEGMDRIEKVMKRASKSP